MQSWSSSMASPEVPVNENFETLEHAATYGNNQATTTALAWGYYGGRYSGVLFANGVLTLADDADNYIVAPLAGGAPTVSTATTNWDDTTYGRCYKVTTVSGLVTAIEDHRAGSLGIGGGGGGSGSESIKIVVDSDYDFIAGDSGKMLVFTFAGNANANLFMPTLPAGWWVDICCLTDGGMDINPDYGSPDNLLDGQNDSVTLATTDGCRIVSDGTNYYTNRGVKPDVVGNPYETYVFKIGDETTPITTGVKYTARMWETFTILGLRASLKTAQGSGSIFTVDFLVNGVSVMTTDLLTVDNTEKSSSTATTVPNITTSSIADDDEITVQVTQVGTPGAAGLVVYLIGIRV